MNHSLRTQLLVGIAATTVTGFAIAAVVIFFIIRAGLRNECDALLAAKARALATLVEQDGDVFEVEFAEFEMQEFVRQVVPEYYQLWDEDGTVLARSKRLGNSNLDQQFGSLATPGFRFTTLPDGRPGRSVSVRFLPGVANEALQRQTPAMNDDDDRDLVDFNHRHVTLVVARGTEEIDQALARLRWVLIIVSTLTTTGMLAALAYFVKRSLNPLNHLAAQIAMLDAMQLTSRVHVEGAPAELSPVVERLNDLLLRLENAFHRERVFAADVAHELRTPLAGLRTTLEVALRRDRDNNDYRQTLQDCQAICLDTQRLVETLLSLARIEAGRDTIDRAYVDVGLLVSRAWQVHEEHALRRGLAVQWHGKPGIFLETDADKLHVVISNVYQNAVEYADEQGSIATQWHVDSAGLKLTVANTGCNLDPQQTRNVFERFWRADAARAATGAHAGLGLALCRKIMHLLGGTIGADTREGSFIVTIHFGPPYIETVDDADSLHDEIQEPPGCQRGVSSENISDQV